MKQNYEVRRETYLSIKETWYGDVKTKPLYIIYPVGDIINKDNFPESLLPILKENGYIVPCAPPVLTYTHWCWKGTDFRLTPIYQNDGLIINWKYEDEGERYVSPKLFNALYSNGAIISKEVECP